MPVYDLRFASLDALSSGFARVSRFERVEHCTVEPDGSRMRFLAPAKVGESIVEQIYLEGGLTWCSRHQVQPLLRRAGTPAGTRAKRPAQR